MLAGLMAVASVAGPMVVSASTLQTSGEFLHYKMGKWTSSGIEYNPYDRTDWFGEWTMDGQVVWCVEPSVTTSTGVEYDSAGDGAIRNGMTVRSIGQTTQPVEPYYVKRASFFTWLIYKASDDEIAQIKDAVKNEAYSAKFVSNIDYVRRLSKNAKWTATQLLIWYTITSVIAHDFQGASSELSDVFYWYATSDGEGIDKQLYTPFRDVYDKLEANNLIEYTGGFRVYDPSSGYQQRQISNGGNFKLIEKKYAIKVRKEFSDITNGVSGKPNFNPSGIKVGVYSDVNATTKVGELVIGPNGESNTIELKAGTYYGFELDVNGNPVKDSAKEVVADGSADRGYVSGKDKDSNNKYVTWNVKGNTTDAVVSTFVNTP